MTVVVTGGAGYIGAHVVRLLRQAGRSVLIVDDLSTGRSDRTQGAPLIRLDLSKDPAPERLARILNEHGAESVVHFAAKKQVGESVMRPAYYYKQNVTGLVHVLEAMETASVNRLVFSSSAAVYGMPDVPLIDERTPLAPINPYGHTKLAGEWLVREAANAWGLRAASLRYFNVAGAGSPDLGDPAVLNLVTMVLDRLSRGERPQVYGADYPTPDGTGIRDYVHVQDLAGAHVAVLDHLESASAGTADTFNVGTGGGTSVLGVIDEIRRVSGLSFDVEVVPRRPGDPASVVADTQRIERQLGWRAERDLHDIIRSAWDAWHVTSIRGPVR